MIPKNEISALLDLIEDPDELVYSLIKDKLISLGPDIVPDLEQAWGENKFGQEYQQKIENIIHEIQLKDVVDGMTNWCKAGAKNLIEGVILVNKFMYPDVDKLKIYEQLNSMTLDAKVSINESDTGIEKVFKLNHVFFDIYKFAGNTKNYYSPDNSILSETLNNKKGNALMLSIIYLEIANRLNIPLSGINLPNHFILGYKDLNKIGKEFGEDNLGILFYINVFSGGEIIYKRDIDAFLEKLKLKKEPKYYSESSNLQIIKRMLVNLHYSFLKKENHDKIKEIKVLEAIIDKYI